MFGTCGQGQKAEAFTGRIRERQVRGRQGLQPGISLTRNAERVKNNLEMSELAGKAYILA